jgi:uncharacterized protein
MSRLILLFALVAIVYWLFKSYRKPPQKTAQPETSEEMVRCAHCGVHLPKSESILAGGEFFCSASHRREHSNRSE